MIEVKYNGLYNNESHFFDNLDDYISQHMPHTLGLPDINWFCENINVTMKNKPDKFVGWCFQMYDQDHNLISPEQIKARAKQMLDAGLL